MKYVETTLAALCFGAMGVLLASDFRGLGTRYDESVARWWSAGSVRRSLRPGFTANTNRRYRQFTGAVLIAIAALLLGSEIFHR